MSSNNNNTAAQPAWKSYNVGTKIDAAGEIWTITRVEHRTTEGGYTSRIFHLRAESGRTAVKTARGLTLWCKGVVSDDSQPIEAEVVEEKSTVEGDLAAAIARAVQPYMERVESSVQSLEQIESLVTAAVGRIVPRTTEIVRFDGSKRDIGTCHTHFDGILRMLAARQNCWVFGPAGSGKTTAAKNAA